MDQKMEARLQRLLDKEQIHDKLMTYCRGVDRGDADLISQAYHPDALANHGYVTFTGQDAGRDITSLDIPPSSSHMIGNLLIEVDGDEAVTEAYMLDMSEHPRDGEPFLFIKCARFVDLWERRDGEWGIAYREVVDSWSRVMAGSEQFPGAEMVTAARTDRDDPVFKIRDIAKRAKDRPFEKVGADQFRARFEDSGFWKGDD